MATTIDAVDAIQAALENEGVLQTIRAQLRASVYNIIAKKSNSVQSRVVQYLKTDEGLNTIDLVFDVLETLNLKESLAVLQSETGRTHQHYRRKELGELFHLTNVGSSPLLEFLVTAQQQPPQRAEYHRPVDSGSLGLSSRDNEEMPGDNYSDVEEDFEDIVEDEQERQGLDNGEFDRRKSVYTPPLENNSALEDDSFEQSENEFKSNISSGNNSLEPQDRKSSIGDGSIAVVRHDLPSLQPITRGLGAAMAKPLPPLQSINQFESSDRFTTSSAAIKDDYGVGSPESKLSSHATSLGAKQHLSPVDKPSPEKSTVWGFGVGSNESLTAKAKKEFDSHHDDEEVEEIEEEFEPDVADDSRNEGDDRNLDSAASSRYQDEKTNGPSDADGHDSGDDIDVSGSNNEVSRALRGEKESDISTESRSGIDDNFEPDVKVDLPEHAPYSRRRRQGDVENVSGRSGAFGMTQKYNVAGKRSDDSESGSEDKDPGRSSIGVQKFEAKSSRSATGWGPTKDDDEVDETPEDDDIEELIDAPGPEDDDEDYSFLGSKDDALKELRNLDKINEESLRDNNSSRRTAGDEVSDSFENDDPFEARRATGDKQLLPGLQPRKFLGTHDFESKASSTSARVDSSFQSEVSEHFEDDDIVVHDEDNDDVLQSSHRSNQEEEEDYLSERGRTGPAPMTMSWGQRVPLKGLSSDEFVKPQSADAPAVLPATKSPDKSTVEEDLEIADDALDRDYESAGDDYDDDYEFDGGAPETTKAVSATAPKSLFSVKPVSKENSDVEDDYGNDFEDDEEAGKDSSRGGRAHVESNFNGNTTGRFNASRNQADDDENDDVIEEIESDVPEEEDMSVGDQDSEASDGFFGEGKVKSTTAVRKQAESNPSSSWANSTRGSRSRDKSSDEDSSDEKVTKDAGNSSLFRSKSGSLPGLGSSSNNPVAATQETKKWTFPTDDDDDDDYFGDKKSSGKALSAPSSTSNSSFKYSSSVASSKAKAVDDDDAVEIMSGGSVASEEDDVLEFSVGHDADAGNSGDESDSYNFGDAKKSSSLVGGNKSTAAATQRNNRSTVEPEDADNSVSEFSVSEHETTSSTSNFGQYDYSTSALPPKKSRW